jgi:uncharacterized protein YlxW (UPF0749 family)
VTSLISRLREIPTWQVTLGLALLVLGFLVAAQLAAEAPRVRYTSEERAPLVETVRGLQAQQDELKATILDLRQAVQDLELEGEGSAQLVRALNEQLQEARIAAGLVPLTGPGLVFRVEDAVAGAQGQARTEGLVSARDLRTLCEELWLAGAEAVAVNGERILGSTAFIDIGGSVLVNAAYLAPPYQVSAIGPADLFERLSASGGFLELIQVRGQSGGIRISFAEQPDVRVPAFAGIVTLSHAAPDPSARTAP